MKCTQCKGKMKCMDTRDHDINKTRRKWVCDACELQGFSYESFPNKLEPRKRNRTDLGTQADRIMRKVGMKKVRVEKVVAPKPTKKHKDVSREPLTGSVFDDMQEDYAPDFTDLGIDIPHTDNW